ncbi:ubiquitin carboxyl-terminal hydrolase 19-like isoform X2 [Rhopilema esculentum]|uniref:ubiquitin carboxyl-terminal hydrolase 19-like isoform X2 n=1 Tax=Rhopilema esculentum TaxID=499914 RepID=UPI0031D7E3B8
MENVEAEHWPLNFMKNDWFSKGNDVIEVHVYVKDVTHCKVNFEEEFLGIYFQTRNEQFYKIHGPKIDGCKPTAFSYSIHTSARIVPEKCSFSVSKTRIELKLMKAIPGHWVSLESRKAVTDRKKACDADNQQSVNKLCEISNNKNECYESRKIQDTKDALADELPLKNRPMAGKSKDSIGRQFGSPENMMLLGGKSTPFSKKSGDQETKVDKETTAVCEPQASSTTKEINIQKNLNKTVTAGLTGLENYANNCYMNVVIQVLANIPEIREYFADDHFLNSLNTQNPMGSGGNVAKAFAEVIKALWCCERKTVVRPQALKHIMGKRCSLFMGFQQCDAQEFFATLLDNLHEDMNQGSRPERSNESASKDEDGPAINEKADTAWEDHFRRNNSVIVKMFHGQMVSKLTCQACRKVSTTYEACGQISLPIAMSKQYFHVIMFFRDPTRQPERIRLQVSSSHAQVWHFLTILERVVSIPANCMRVFQDSRGSCSVTVDENAPVTAIRNSRQVIVCETKDEKEADTVSLPFRQNVINTTKTGKCASCSKSQNDLEVKLKRCARCLYIAYCSQDCQSKHWALHRRDCRKGMRDSIGLPFFVTLRKQKLSYDTLSAMALQYARFSVSTVDKDSDEGDAGESDEKNRPLNIDSEACQKQASVPSDVEPEERKQSHKCDGALNTGAKTVENTQKSKEGGKDEKKRHSKLEGACNFSTSDEFIIKAFMKQDQEPVVLSSDDFKADTVLSAAYFAIEWQNNHIKEKDTKDLYASFRRRQSSLQDDETVDSDKCSVEDCFSMFLEPERLHEKDGWKCPKCKSIQAVKKEMALSYPPPILLVHFKRFTFASYGQKVTKGISYPICGLDLSPYIAEETRGLLTTPPVYDLTGVICHKGSMGIGHYTCMVRSLSQQGQTDIGWRYFDDDHVVKIDDERVIDPSAYVLVYRMRETPHDLKADYPFPLGSATATEGNKDKTTAQSRLPTRHLSVDSGIKEYSNLSMENPAGKDHLRQYTRKQDHGSGDKPASLNEHRVDSTSDSAHRSIPEMIDSNPCQKEDTAQLSGGYNLEQVIDGHITPLFSEIAMKKSNINFQDKEVKNKIEFNSSIDSHKMGADKSAYENISRDNEQDNQVRSENHNLSGKDKTTEEDQLNSKFTQPELHYGADSALRGFDDCDINEDDID